MSALSNFLLVAGLLITSSCEASTAIHVDVELADSPALALGSSDGFFRAVLDGSGDLGAYQLGLVASGSIPELGLSRIESASGGWRSTPTIAIPISVVHAVASSGYPQPRIVLAGQVGFSNMRLMAYCRDEKLPCLDRPLDSSDGVNAIAVAGPGNEADIELLVGGNSKVRLESRSGTTAWEVATGRVSAMSYLAATASFSPRVAVAATTLQMRSMQGGALDAELALPTAMSTSSMIAGKTAGSDEIKLFLWSRLGGVSAYGTEPLRLLWSNPAIRVVSATLARRNSSALQDLFVVDEQGQLRQLDGNGTVTGFGITASNTKHVTSFSTGATTRLLLASGLDGSVTAVNRSNIAMVETVWTRYAGHFNQFVLSDLAGDGQPKLVSLSKRPFASTFPVETWLRIVDSASGEEEWASRFPPDAPAGGYDRIIEMTVGKNIGDAASTIYLFSAKTNPAGQLLIEVDGTTRTMRSRRSVDFGHDRYAFKALPFVRQDRAKLAVLSVSGNIASPELARLHVVDVETLAIEWSSAILGDGDIGAFMVHQPSTQDAAVAYFSNYNSGVYAFDLFSGSLLFSIPASPGALTLLRNAAGPRILYFDISLQSLVSVDASTGVRIDTRPPLYGEVHAMAQDPTHSNRIVIAYNGTFCSYDYAAGQCALSSVAVGRWAQLTYGHTGKLIAREADGAAEFLAGNEFGIWRARIVGDTLFRSGFDPGESP